MSIKPVWMKPACPACQDHRAFVLPPVEDQPRMVQCAGCKNISAIKPGDAQPAAQGFEAKSFNSVAGTLFPNAQMAGVEIGEDET